MVLRDLAAAWVGANCPSTHLREDFLQKLDAALQQGVGCSFVIGRQLTKSGEPFFIQCFCGEFFVFQLTPRQVARLDGSDNQLIAAHGVSRHYHEPRPAPAVRLEHVEVDHADQLPLASLITGTLHYRCEQSWLTPLVVQAACEPPGRGTRIFFHHFNGLAHGEGTIRFSLPPIGDVPNQKGRAFVDVAPLFFQICMAVEARQDAVTGSLADPFTVVCGAGWIESHAAHSALPRHSDPLVLGEPLPLPPPIPAPTIPPAIAQTMWPQPMGVPRAGMRQPPRAPASVPPHFQAISDIRGKLIEVMAHDAETK